MQGDNRAAKYRTAHLKWLLDNNVFTLNSTDEWQPDLRRWTPSSSARYPLRMKKPKQPTDPEACKFAQIKTAILLLKLLIMLPNSLLILIFFFLLLNVAPQDCQVHIYHSKKDRLWVKQWISGMLEANRFNVTTNKQPSRNGSRMILVLSPELFNEPFSSDIISAIQGKTLLGIKLRDCDVPEEIEKEYNSYMDLMTADLSDLTYHVTFMFRVQKSLKLPLSICSA